LVDPGKEQTLSEPCTFPEPTTSAAAPAAISLADLSPRELHEHVLAAISDQRRSMYRLMVLTRRLDACAGHRALGCVTLRQYLELTCGISGIAARERVRVALALGELPLIDAAMACGELSYSKVRAISRVATPDTEKEWLEAARDATADELDTMVARSQPGEARQHRLHAYALDRHTTRMVVDLPTEEMEVVQRALERVRKAAGGKLAASQALVYMAADSLAGETREVATHERYTVVVHAGKDGTAWMETASGDAPLRPQVVQRLLCDCSVRLAREEADGTSTVSRKQRTIPHVTRRALELRDRRRCRVPGCPNRLWLEAHHRVPRAQGGRHTRNNLVLVCTQHHQMCHDGSLIVEDAGGKIVFRAANGWILGKDGALWHDPDRRQPSPGEGGDGEGAPAPEVTREKLPGRGDRGLDPGELRYPEEERLVVLGDPEEGRVVRRYGGASFGREVAAGYGSLVLSGRGRDRAGTGRFGGSGVFRRERGALARVGLTRSSLPTAAKRSNVVRRDPWKSCHPTAPRPIPAGCRIGEDDWCTPDEYDSHHAFLGRAVCMGLRLPDQNRQVAEDVP
jgi:hypothetical protein